MPRSRRAKIVALTQTSKKGKEGKKELINKIKLLVEEYPTVFLFHPINMRSDLMKDIRNHFKSNSKIVFGKNSIMKLALGSNEENELKPGLHQLAQLISGHCGLMFTKESPSNVEEFFANYRVQEFARSGFRANKTITVEKGPLTQFDASLEPYLRQQGLPTELKNGVINCLVNYTLCEEGEELTPEQCTLLKFFEEKMAEFRIVLRCCYHQEEFIQFF
eukprot:TRINITY_DN926_c0_g1_i1.p1 TRINITY_DN926_c0_g1~~TRINITY_DN926_c0_g1_i1.p1  ORF type:complete len:219 (-),score=47.65 TRINITY_DN926_c0_g1_i1:29-685(-)